jgi:hypothetical protein
MIRLKNVKREFNNLQPFKNEFNVYYSLAETRSRLTMRRYSFSFSVFPIKVWRGLKKFTSNRQAK